MNRRRVLQQANLDKDMVIMTSDTNPKILSILYNAGLCASPDVMYKSEAEAVQNTDIPQFRDVSENFDAFQYFTSITSLRTVGSYGQFHNAKFTSIVFPNTLVRTGGMHWFDDNRCAVLRIPASVTFLNQYGPAWETINGIKITFIFEGITPPRLDTYMMCIGKAAYTEAIYVPDGYVDTYKDAWKNCHNWNIGMTTVEYLDTFVKPISEYTNS